jgi:plastocyanin
MTATTARRLVATAAVALAVVGLAACGDDAGDATTATTAADSGTSTTTGAAGGPVAGDGETVTVDIADFAFAPQELTIDAGQPVVWTNTDDFAHTAQTAGDGFDTGAIEGGSSSEPVTLEPGTYEYFCGIHNYMTGTITVQG